MSHFSLTSHHWSTLCNLWWGGPGRLCFIWSGHKPKKVDPLCRVLWVDILTACSEISTGLQLCSSVPDWSPEVFGLASLSVWSGCFWDSDWPALRPNASLSSKLLRFSFALSPSLGYRQDYAQFHSFLDICKVKIKQCSCLCMFIPHCY